MIINYKLFFIFLMIVFFNSERLLAQDLSKDLAAFSELVMSDNGISFRIEQEIMESKDSKHVEHVEMDYKILKGDIKVSGKLVESIKTKDATLIVVHGQKMMLCSKVKGTKKGQEANQLSSTYDFLSLIDSSEMVSSKPIYIDRGDTKEYILKDRMDLGLEELKIIFDKTNNTLLSVLLIYYDNNLGYPYSLNMEYSKYNLKPRITHSTFQLDEFINTKTTPWSLSNDYKQKSYALDLN